VTLRAQITSDVAAVFLNNEDFAETLYYKPKDSDQRTLTCVVDEDDDYQDQDTGIMHKRVLSVFASRSASTGIDTPQLGDRISRAIDGTGDDAVWYAFAGNVTDIDENAWTVKFQRETPYKIGGNRQ
jgi:hypothetical protein